jgi:nucleoside phosphorylase
VGMGGALREPRASVISCGVAAGLKPGVPTGAIVIPDRVLGAGDCDPELTDLLRRSAKELGLVALTGSLAVADRIVAGPRRAELGARGAVAADMESGALFGSATRVAAVRVVLDTPEREISADWLRPLPALARPAAWPEAWWLARATYRCSSLAGAVVAHALARRG